MTNDVTYKSQSSEVETKDVGITEEFTYYLDRIERLRKVGKIKKRNRTFQACVFEKVYTQ